MTAGEKISLYDELAQGAKGLIANIKWPVAKEGLPFIIPAALLTVSFIAMGWSLLTFLGFFATLFVTFFFRNPKRKIPSLENIILSPADGRL
jgi:phosphatidylserine decarboxylase